jgi:antitoxin PrlF
MALATLTSKGQITIPKKVREHLQLKTGDRLDFRIEKDGSIRIYPIARKVAEVFGAFAEKAKRPYSTTEVKDHLKQAFKKRNR